MKPHGAFEMIWRATLSCCGTGSSKNCQILLKILARKVFFVCAESLKDSRLFQSPFQWKSQVHHGNTLESLIIGPPCLLIFRFFSHQEILIPTPLFINFESVFCRKSRISIHFQLFSHQDILIPTPLFIIF